MRKSGFVSLLSYIAMFLGYGIPALTIYIEANNGKYQGWDGLGFGLLMIFCMIYAVPAGIAMLLKILHVTTGIGLFGILCMLIDVAAFGIIVYYFIAGGASLETLITFWYASLPIVVLPVTFVANVKSLGG